MSDWLAKKGRLTVEEPFDGLLIPVQEFAAFWVYLHEVIFIPPPPPGTTGYCLGHAPTGLVILRGLPEEDCKKIAEYLWSRHCLVFKLDEKEALVQKCPSAVHEWLKQCQEKKQWVDPQGATT